MALAASNLATSWDNVDRTTSPGYSTASISPAADSLLLVCIHWGAATTAATTMAVSGLGLTWTQVMFDADGIRTQFVFRAQCGSSPGSGALTFTWSAGDATQIGCQWSVIQITGHDTTTPVVQTKIVGGDNTTANAPTGTLDSAISAADNRAFCFVSKRNTQATNPRTNWTELGEAISTSAPSESLESQWRNDGTNETTFGATWTTAVRYQMFGLEIAAAAAAAGRPKVWTGSAWVAKPAKVWSGSAWVEKPVKVWSGSAWVTVD
jgi:hypothetical protein